MSTPEPIRYRSKAKQPAVPAAGIVDLSYIQARKQKRTEGEAVNDRVVRRPTPNPIWGDRSFRATTGNDIFDLGNRMSVEWRLNVGPQPTNEQIQQYVETVNSTIAVRYMMLGMFCADYLTDALDLSPEGVAEIRAQLPQIIQLVQNYAELNNKLQAKYEAEQAATRDLTDLA